MATQKTLDEQIAQSKLRALAQGVRIWRLEGSEPRMWAVPSSSNDGTAYLLEIHNQDNGDITCTCPANVYRNTCKHVGALMLALDASAQLEMATAAAQARPEPSMSDNLESELADLF
jgi:hypothetical protein